MRDPEELAKDIDRFTLEREIRREIVYTAADIPALERENVVDQRRLEGLDADSPEARHLRDEVMRARTWKIERLKERDGATVTETRRERVPSERGIDGLGDFIRANWTIREILLFDDFTHGGAYDAGKGWRINYAGYLADTAEGQRNLIGLFKHLCREAYFFIGVKASAGMRAGVPPVVLWTRFDPDEASPLDMTLDALIRSIPSKAQK